MLVIHRDLYSLRKKNYTRSRLRNNYLKFPSVENEKLFKVQRNKCVSLRKKCIKSYFQKVSENGINSNKAFWRIVKPFITNKNCHEQNDIILNENGKVIINENELAETFNEHYINIVERSSGKKPSNIALENHNLDTNTILKQILSNYSNHSSVKKVKEVFKNCKYINSFQFEMVSQSDIENYLNMIDS